MLTDESVVHVNVGGSRFATTLGTLRVHRTSALCQFFSPPYPIHNDLREGGTTFFIDRNGEVFDLVLDYLRNGTLVVPRDPVRYTILRREVVFYGLPIGLHLPPSQPLMWEAAPIHYRHARIVVEEFQKIIQWEEGQLPHDLNQCTLMEIIQFFSAKGYKVVSEYVSRGTRGLTSIWMRKKEYYPGIDVAIEISSDAIGRGHIEQHQTTPTEVPAIKRLPPPLHPTGAGFAQSTTQDILMPSISTEELPPVAVQLPASVPYDPPKPLSPMEESVMIGKKCTSRRRDEDGTFFCDQMCGEGNCWGSGPYTGDSKACIAARHSGIIGPHGGSFRVESCAALPTYQGSTANGITTSSWGSYPTAFNVFAVTDTSDIPL